MLNWLSGKKEGGGEAPREKGNIQSGPELDEGQKWVYDYISQYLRSPIWRNPILDFIEENCLIFEDNEENKFEYTKIFQEFIGLATLLIESMLEETGIPESTLEKCILKGLRSQRDRKVFQQILLCDNFLAFKKIMVAKNRQLQLEALKHLQKQEVPPEESHRLHAESEIAALDVERLEIEKAIAISLALSKKAAEQEERDLAEALRLSTIEAEPKQPQPPVPPQPSNPAGMAAGSKSGESKFALPPLVLGTTRPNKPIEELHHVSEMLRKEISMKAEALTQGVESVEARKQRLQEQRELIKKKNHEERKVELQTFVHDKEQPPVQAPGEKSAPVSEEELERRRNLMKRLKEQLKE